ncbi:MAG: hypothetical protein KDD47_12575 [Acidobacteria bacterium]|nr:hypothetical protein [Acidobacteriota bacterium]
MVIQLLLSLVGLYLAAGVVFALVFHRQGLVRMDPGVEGGGWFFRLLITPGLVALWPVLWRKGRRSLRGDEVAGSAEGPIAPAGLRAFHRWAVTLLALGLPVLVAAGFLLRPAVPIEETAPTAVPRPLPAELLRLGPPPEGLALTGLIRGGGAGRRQIELEVAEDLEIPSLALFVAPEDGPGLPSEAVFVGPVYGPDRLRYELPKRRSGVFIFYSLAQQRRVASWEYLVDYQSAAGKGN